MALSAAHINVFTKVIQKHPLAELEEIVSNLIKESGPFTLHTMFERLSIHKDPLATSITALKDLEAEQKILQDAIANFEVERDRKPFGEGESESKELKTIKQQLTAACEKFSELPSQQEKKREALRQAETQINNDILRQLEEEKLQTAQEIKSQGERAVSLSTEQLRLRAAVEAKQQEINDKCCGCMSCCTKKETAEKAQLQAQFANVSQKLAVLDKELKTPIELNVKSKAIALLEQKLQANRDEAKKYSESSCEAELKQAKQVVIDLEVQEAKIEDKLENEKKFFNAWVSNDLMLQILRVYERFNHLMAVVKSGHEADMTNTHLVGLNALCIDYKNDFYGLLGLIWCANSNDKTGLEIYEAFAKLPPTEQVHLFDKLPTREFLDQFLPNVKGRKLDALLKHEMRVPWNFFRPKHITHALQAATSATPARKLSSSTAST